MKGGGTLPGFCFLEEEVIRSLTFLSGAADWVDLPGCLLVFVLTCSTVAFLAGPFFLVGIPQSRRLLAHSWLVYEKRNTRPHKHTSAKSVQGNCTNPVKVTRRAFNANGSNSQSTDLMKIDEENQLPEGIVKPSSNLCRSNHYEETSGLKREDFAG